MLKVRESSASSQTKIQTGFIWCALPLLAISLNADTGQHNQRSLPQGVQIANCARSCASARNKCKQKTENISYLGISNLRTYEFRQADRKTDYVRTHHTRSDSIFDNHILELDYPFRCNGVYNQCFETCRGHLRELFRKPIENQHLKSGKQIQAAN